MFQSLVGCWVTSARRKGSRSSCRAVDESLSYSLRWDLFLMAKPFCWGGFFMLHGDSDKRSFGCTSLIFPWTEQTKQMTTQNVTLLQGSVLHCSLSKTHLSNPLSSNISKNGRTPVKDFLFNHNSCWTYKTNDQAADLTKLPHTVCVLWGLSWWGKVPPTF